MFQAHIRPAFSHIVNQGCNHYILYMMIPLYLSPKQAALLSHAIVEFQDNFHQLSHEDMSISKDDISELQNLVDQILDQTKVEVYLDVTPHVFQNVE
jgi:hypothetical protein